MPDSNLIAVNAVDIINIRGRVKDTQRYSKILDVMSFAGWRFAFEEGEGARHGKLLAICPDFVGLSHKV